MKKHIILLSAAGLLFSSCGVYTKYKPATEVPDGFNAIGSCIKKEDT